MVRIESDHFLEDDLIRHLWLLVSGGVRTSRLNSRPAAGT
jgi:hypothetical protein